MSKSVVKKEEQKQELAIAVDNDSFFGLDEITTKDIKIPLIYLAQNMSELVSEGDAKPGDIVDNLNNSVLGSMKSPAQVVPLYFKKSYVVQKLVNGKKTFLRLDDYDKEREYEEVTNDGTVYNLPCYNFFCLVKGDEAFTTYLLSFRGSRNITSAGRPMLSQIMNKWQNLKAAPYNYIFDIGVKKVENEKGSWFVFTSTLAKDEDGKEIITDEKTKSYAQTAAKNLEAMFKSGGKLDTSLDKEVNNENDEEIF